MGWLGSGMRVSDSFQIIPRPCGSVRVRTPRRGSVRVRTPSLVGVSPGGIFGREGCLRGELYRGVISYFRYFV